MNEKKWWMSKSFWLGTLIIVGGIAEYIAGLPPGASIAAIIAGCLTIVIRVFTNTAITGTPGAKVK